MATKTTAKKTTAKTSKTAAKPRRNLKNERLMTIKEIAYQLASVKRNEWTSQRYRMESIRSLAKWAVETKIEGRGATAKGWKAAMVNIIAIVDGFEIEKTWNDQEAYNDMYDAMVEAEQHVG